MSSSRSLVPASFCPGGITSQYPFFQLQKTYCGPYLIAQGSLGCTSTPSNMRTPAFVTPKKGQPIQCTSSGSDGVIANPPIIIRGKRKTIVMRGISYFLAVNGVPYTWAGDISIW